MATQVKSAKFTTQPLVPLAAPASPAPPQAEPPLAQYESNFGDRVVSVIWVVGAVMLMLHFFLDTILGFLAW